MNLAECVSHSVRPGRRRYERFTLARTGYYTFAGWTLRDMGVVYDSRNDRAQAGLFNRSLELIRPGRINVQQRIPSTILAAS